MNQKFLALSTIGLIAGALMMVTPVSADMCTTQYGGTTTCSPSDLTINKQVKDPKSNTFVENLTSTDTTFTPGTEIDYRLTIKNNSGQTFDPVNVKDTFPPYLTFVSGPGSYDSTNRVLNITMNNLIAGETRTVDIATRVVDANQFPSGKSLFCVVNVGEVSALNRHDSDSAQACLQNGVLGVTTMPVAGVNDWMMLLPFAGVGLGGVALLKKRS